MLRSVCLCLDLCVYASLGKSKRGAKGPGQDRRKCGCASELLETQRHGLVLVCYARLAPAPYPIVLADAAPSAFLAGAPYPSVLADARPSALLAGAPYPSVLADAAPSALLASALYPIVLADALSPAIPTPVPYPSCLLYTSPSPRDKRQPRMPSSA